MNFALEPKDMPFAQFTPAPLINVDHYFLHYYGHFVSGQHCAGGRGDVLPGIGIFEQFAKKTVKCLIIFATDCRLGSQNLKMAVGHAHSK